jgi:nucleotide-binding universal stress UspA family protein
MGADPPPMELASEPEIKLATAVCGIDSSPQSTEAARQAIAVTDEGAHLYAVAVWDPRLAMHAGIHASEVAVDLRQEATTALQRIREVLPAVEPVLIRGNDVAGLLAAATNLEADLISVASHGTSRAAGIVFGSVATAMVHHAPCCVLVAREPTEAGSFPRVVLHAGDGSPDSIEAARQAGRIAAKHDATVVTLHVRNGPDPGERIAEEAASIIESCGREPVREGADGPAHRRIVEVAEKIGASLILVGSRGLTGLKALGSVSERVAHRAPCSVLIVRRPVLPAEDQMIQ